MGMQIKFEHDIIISRDNLKLSCLDYVPKSALLTDVFVHVHGLESHNGWVTQLGTSFAKEGWAFSGLDRRGSGLSEGVPGDAESVDILIDDINRGIERARKKYPTARIHLMGLCLGARTSILYAQLHFTKLASLVLISPSLYLRRQSQYSPWMKILLALAAHIQPKRHFSSPLEDWMFSDDQNDLTFLRHDPKKLKHATARLLYSLFVKTRTKRLIHVISNSCKPVHIISAGKWDYVLDTEKIEKEIKDLSENNKYISLTVFPNANHLIYFQSLDSLIKELRHFLGNMSEGTGPAPKNCLEEIPPLTREN
jgi:alpha-beta hydrolase superfamily lysophospholipase